jgi:putative hydrolase of the HAD superfamily
VKRHRKAVLFDLYGTLVDIAVDEESDSFWNGISRWLNGSTHLSGEQLRELYFALSKSEVDRGNEEGSVLRETLTRLLISAGCNADDFTIRRFARFFREHSLLELKERAYARPVLRAVKNSGCTCGLVSNTEALLTDYDLDRLNLGGAFETMCLSSDVGAKKPDRKIFEKALMELGVKSSEALFVGDDLHTDVAGAREVGLDVIFLSDKASSGDDAGHGTEVVRCRPEESAIKTAMQRMGVPLPD